MHKIERKYGGENESGWIQPVCSCGWEGGFHYAYDDYQHHHVQQDANKHIQSTKIGAAIMTKVEDLHKLALIINEATNNPIEHDIGHYMIDLACGGYKLVQVTIKRDVYDTISLPSGVMDPMLRAYLKGIRDE